MGFGLRLMRSENDNDRLSNAPRQSAREILALVSVSGLKFHTCLRLCTAQARLTPGFTYWQFAENYKQHFDSLFSALKTNSTLEEGLSLANMFIMMVYLRVAARLNSSDLVRTLEFLYLTGSQSTFDDLFTWVEQYANQINTDFVFSDESQTFGTESTESINLPDFNHHIRRVLGNTNV